jgi:hypothetical protein
MLSYILSHTKVKTLRHMFSPCHRINTSLIFHIFSRNLYKPGSSINCCCMKEGVKDLCGNTLLNKTLNHNEKCCSIFDFG